MAYVLPIRQATRSQSPGTANRTAHHVRVSQYCMACRRRQESQLSLMSLTEMAGVSRISTL